jgi:hypothetical protein
MVRPHVVSLAASLALLSFLVRGRWWQVLLLSALVSWVHLSLFWIAPCIAIAYGLVRIPVTVLLGREGPDTGVPIRQAVPAAFAGALLGWLLRPDPVATATLLQIQLVQLFSQKATGQPLTFAAELSPVGVAELVRTSWFFLVVWFVAVGASVRAALRGRWEGLGQARATFLCAALVISGAFLGLALVSARRALEQWVAFGALALPLVWELTARREAGGDVPSVRLPARADLRALGGVKLALVALLLVHLGWGIHRHRLNVQLVSFPATTLREVAEYLRDNSEPGDIVFHARWDNFGPLFAFDRSNRYLGGMDPIFQFAHDPRSYWEFFYLSTDLNTDWTCDAYPCTSGVATDTHEALVEHFGARWVVVEPRRNPRLTLYFLNDPGYALELETQREALFRILPE